MKMPKFGTENALLSIFGQEFLRTIVLFENSNLEFVKHESLTHTMNFDIGSAFSKGLGSAFSEGSVPGSGPLYKVCLYFDSVMHKIFYHYERSCFFHMKNLLLRILTQAIDFALLYMLNYCL